MSDYDRVKAWREKNRKNCPGNCGSTIAHNSAFCRPCAQIEKRRVAESRTVAQVKAENKSKRWTDHVRYFARQRHAARLTACEVCGYDKHVEVAHIKDIASFPDEATIAEINADDNVRGLCPNHHWEYDSGLLAL